MTVEDCKCVSLMEQKDMAIKALWDIVNGKDAPLAIVERAMSKIEESIDKENASCMMQESNTGEGSEMSKKIKVYATVDDESGANPHVIGIDDEGSIYITHGEVDISPVNGILDIEFEKLDSGASIDVELCDIDDKSVEKFGMFVGCAYVPE